MSKKKSKSEINELLQIEIEKAIALGFDLYEISPKVKYIDTERLYGQCSCQNNKCEIKLATFMKWRPRTEISAVLMHEVLHSVIGNKGHGKEWKSCVRRVLSRYSYKGFEDCHLCEHPYSKKRPLPRKKKTKVA